MLVVKIYLWGKEYNFNMDEDEIQNLVIRNKKVFASHCSTRKV